MKIGGKATEWRAPAEFTINTPCGEVRINAEGCTDDALANMLMDAMKGRAMVYMEAGA